MSFITVDRLMILLDNPILRKKYIFYASIHKIYVGGSLKNYNSLGHHSKKVEKHCSTPLLDSVHPAKYMSDERQNSNLFDL